MLAIFFAAFLTVGMRGLQIGTYEYNIKSAINQFTGYIQIQKKEFYDNPTLRNSYQLNDTLISILENTQYIKNYSRRIISQGLIGNSESSYGASIFGFDPEQEPTVTKIHEKIIEGRFLEKGDIFETVIGVKLAENLGVAVGDTVIILSSGFDGTMGNYKFVIVGISKFGQTQLDAISVMIPFQAADMLLSMYGRITALAIAIDNLDNLAKTESILESKIDSNYYAILDWQELMPDMKQNVELDNLFGLFFLSLLILIVAFGILNTILMSVTERFREFGVMLALGTKHKVLVSSVFWETMFITMISVFAGLLFGLIANVIIMNNPIVLGGDLAKMSQEYGFQPQIHSIVKVKIFINAFLRIVGITLLIFVFPMIKLYNLEPLKGIRYT